MPRSKSMIFQTKEAPKIDFRIRISEELKTRSDQLQERLKAARPDLVFSPNDILEAALEDAVKAGEKEMVTLEKISSKSSNDTAQSPSLPNTETAA